MTPEQKLKVVAEHDDVISINNRKKLGEVKKDYPNLPVIIGAPTENDVPVTLDLAEMEYSKTQIIDAATETITGKRIDRLEKPSQIPVHFIISAVSFIAGVAVTFFVYNI